MAKQALRGLRTVLARPVVHLQPVLVNGAAGVVVAMGGTPAAVIGFTVAEAKSVEIDAIAAPGASAGLHRPSSPASSRGSSSMRLQPGNPDVRRTCVPVALLYGYLSFHQTIA